MVELKRYLVIALVVVVVMLIITHVNQLREIFKLPPI